MNSASVLNKYYKTKKLFQFASALQLLTSYLWPVPLPIKNGLGYDYIIIGGGTAGCVIASRLVELANVSVLLIEAGGNPPLESNYASYFAYMKHTAQDWNLTANKEDWMANQQSGKAAIIQGKMLGGSSSLSHLTYTHGHPADYDAWATIAEDQSWSFKKIHDYFIKTERIIIDNALRSRRHKNMFGTKGSLKIRKYFFHISERYLGALKEIGFKIVRYVNARNPIGFTHVLNTYDKKVRQSTAYSYLRPLKYNNQLNVLTNIFVQRIIFDVYDNAIGVEVIDTDNNLFTINAFREVILTAGVFKTPQLLMISGIGPKRVLNRKRIHVISNIPVGKNLQDHPVCVLVFKMGLKKTVDEPSLTPYKLNYPQLHGYVSLAEFHTDPTYGIRSFVLNNPETFLKYCLLVFNFKNRLCDDLAKAVDNHEIFLVLNHLAYPESRGEVSLGSKNIRYDPTIKLKFYDNDFDLETHARSVMHFNRILNSRFFKKNNAEIIDSTNCGTFNFTNLNYWKCYCKNMVTTLHDHVGTCAMGSVVNSNLLVKGVHRLRVADASVMPDIVSSPTLASVILIAEKASDLIKKDYIRYSSN